MLNFPFYSLNSFGSFCIFLLIIPLVCGIISELRKAKKGGDPVTFALIAYIVCALLFFCCGFFFSYLTLKEVSQFRNIQISEVKSLKVVKSESEYSSNGEKQIIIIDRQIINQGLESLQKCNEFSPNHETFSSGYKINLFFEDEKLNGKFYFSVYRRSNSNLEKAVVMPHIGTDRSINLGVYNCFIFHQWIKENIDPFFDKEKGSSN